MTNNYTKLNIAAPFAKSRIAMIAVGLMGIVALLLAPMAAFAAPNGAGNGFDQYGYNDKARVFNGTCVNWYIGKNGGTEANAIAKYCGDYANDRIVMKWNQAWDDCNAAGGDDEAACAGAWLTNQWNGHVADGSGETWQYKFIWVGSEAEDSEYWRDGGEVIWDNYETITSRGNAADGHSVLLHVTPNGLGKH